MPQSRISKKYTNVGKRRPDLNNVFFRSKWEANIARWLNHLIEMEEVESWEYEPDEFEFPVKRGKCKFYKPDFCVVYNISQEGGAPPKQDIHYLEVKGHLTAESKTKLSRMKRYFPDVKVEIIEKAAYASIEKDACRIIAGWE